MGSARAGIVATVSPARTTSDVRWTNFNDHLLTSAMARRTQYGCLGLGSRPLAAAAKADHWTFPRSEMHWLTGYGHTSAASGRDMPSRIGVGCGATMPTNPKPETRVVGHIMSTASWLK